MNGDHQRFRARWPLVPAMAMVMIGVLMRAPLPLDSAGPRLPA